MKLECKEKGRTGGGPTSQRNKTWKKKLIRVQRRTWSRLREQMKHSNWQKHSSGETKTKSRKQEFLLSAGICTGTRPSREHRNFIVRLEQKSRAVILGTEFAEKHATATSAWRYLDAVSRTYLGRQGALTNQQMAYGAEQRPLFQNLQFCDLWGVLPNPESCHCALELTYPLYEN